MYPKKWDNSLSKMQIQEDFVGKQRLHSSADSPPSCATIVFYTDQHLHRCAMNSSIMKIKNTRYLHILEYI